MESRSLGIIGGMGPKATSVFFNKIVDYTVANSDQEHINMVILNHASLPDRTSVILSHQEKEFLEAVKQDIRLLELARVANIAIPCNTSHFFYEQMQSMTKINIINMIEETIKEIYSLYGENCKIGILATRGTIKSAIYEQWCSKYSITLHIPNELQQEEVMNIIYNNVKSDLNTNPTKLEGLIHDLVYKEKCRCVILACTELSCIQLGDEIMKYCIDSLEVLVERAIKLSGKTSKRPLINEPRLLSLSVNN
jgi:aspartate racemase